MLFFLLMVFALILAPHRSSPEFWSSSSTPASLHSGQQGLFVQILAMCPSFPHFIQMLLMSGPLHFDATCPKSWCLNYLSGFRVGRTLHGYICSIQSWFFRLKGPFLQTFGKQLPPPLVALRRSSLFSRSLSFHHWSTLAIRPLLLLVYHWI